jgi:hypothetical protein
VFAFYQVELRIRCLLKHHLLEFAKTIRLSSPPTPFLLFDEGPPVASLRIHGVTALDESKFLVQADDDGNAARQFGDNRSALITWYEALGWVVYDSCPIEFITPEPDEDDEDDTWLEEPEGWSSLQKFLGGASA